MITVRVRAYFPKSCAVELCPLISRILKDHGGDWVETYSGVDRNYSMTVARVPKENVMAVRQALIDAGIALAAEDL